MSARSRMTMRAVLQVDDNAGTVDELNQPVAPDWETDRNIPCYAWTQMKKQVIDGNKLAIVEDFRAMVPRGTAIADEDRLLNITDRQGVEIFAGPIRIEAMQVRKDHLELILKTIDSGTDLSL